MIRTAGVDDPVRAFKHRRGRITSGQQRALDSLHGVYGLAPSNRLIDPEAVFGRRAPLILEIGFGMGGATLAMAVDDPSRDVLAVDVHTPGAGALLRALDARGLSNVRVVVADAVDVLTAMIAPGSLAEIRVYFPDPWPKARHRKRRLVGPGFARLAADRLAPGGVLHCATDWEPYAAQMASVVRAEPRFTVDADGFTPRPAGRPITRFERQALAAGRPVVDLIARRELGGSESGADLDHRSVDERAEPPAPGGEPGDPDEPVAVRTPIGGP